MTLKTQKIITLVAAIAALFLISLVAYLLGIIPLAVFACVMGCILLFFAAWMALFDLILFIMEN